MDFKDLNIVFIEKNKWLLFIGCRPASGFAVNMAKEALERVSVVQEVIVFDRPNAQELQLIRVNFVGKSRSHERYDLVEQLTAAAQYPYYAAAASAHILREEGHHVGTYLLVSMSREPRFLPELTTDPILNRAERHLVRPVGDDAVELYVSLRGGPTDPQEITADCRDICRWGGIYVRTIEEGKTIKVHDSDLYRLFP